MFSGVWGRVLKCRLGGFLYLLFRYKELFGGVDGKYMVLFVVFLLKDLKLNWKVLVLLLVYRKCRCRGMC